MLSNQEQVRGCGEMVTGLWVTWEGKEVLKDVLVYHEIGKEVTEKF